LPAVLNECFLQSYSGTLRIFPNTTNLGPARFRNLRAAGAFLVTAAWDGHTISPVSIFSEKGATVRLVRPWSSGKIEVTTVSDGQSVLMRTREQIAEFDTRAGQEYVVQSIQ